MARFRASAPLSIEVFAMSPSLSAQVVRSSPLRACDCRID